MHSCLQQINGYMDKIKIKFSCGINWSVIAITAHAITDKLICISWKACTTKRKRFTLEQQAAGSSTNEYGYSDTEALSALSDNEIEQLPSEHLFMEKVYGSVYFNLFKGTQTDNRHLITNYKESAAECNMHSITWQTNATQFQIFYILKE